MFSSDERVLVHVFMNCSLCGKDTLIEPNEAKKYMRDGLVYNFCCPSCTLKAKK